MGSNNILIALSPSSVICVGTSVTGPSFMVTVEVPFKRVELLLVFRIGSPFTLKSYIEWVWLLVTNFYYTF